MERKDNSITIRISSKEKETLDQDARDNHKPVSEFLLSLWRKWKDSK